MTTLARAVERYLALRRSLGYKLVGPDQILRSFAAFAAREGRTYVTADLAERWARSRGSEATSWARRLGYVRQFAEYRVATDPRTEIPARELIPARFDRKQPYIYDDHEVVALIRAARAMRSPTGLRAATYSTLLGLFAVTGMRFGEAIGLDRGDVDLARGVLRVRHGKGGKERLLPVHETTRQVLLRYGKKRDRIHPRPKTDAFLVSEHGERLSPMTAEMTFVRLSRQVGLRMPVPGKSELHHGQGPRIYDLRHRFAVMTLVRWYRSGVDVEARLPLLSAYLGHVKVSTTYWYLTAIPELLQLAMRRMEGGRP